jgi:2-C-methyl-D-erythritol 4-phosphate cytidylyltransferase
VARAARRTGAALAAWPVPDTIKASRGKRVRRTVPRDGLWLAQTPQGFRRDVADRLFRRPTRSLTDDVQLAERAGVPVELVPASSMNFKVTLPEDFALCRRLLK